ncbi:TonB-dependent receptor [Phenylobacterium sp.]|uniref:TonB-dependent receptor family protein n=1 Tax=Phenylobacterium sp. TaxID=1871053 RepID=UPI001201D0E8|nr:TonB-dependent receptor [Phenylobacterium sp.]THD68628.1 MAG: TonB-dependent receptor [Phenylobacterium sp.]
MHRVVSTVFAAAVCCAPLLAHAADEAAPTAVSPLVVVATPLDSAGVSLSRTPSNAQSLDARDPSQQGATNLADLLNGSLGSVSVSDGSGNPYQNDVNYRGYQATSLLGAPVGLAVYFDGVRVNEPFGSIVNWDLIPMNAISTVNVQPGSNPIFGLNALGGTLVVNTRNGKESPGFAVSLLGGSFGRRAATFEAGGSDARTSTDYFVAGNWDKQDGFRDFSGSEVKQLFGKLRWHGPENRTLVELSGAFADTELAGTQALPLDMLSTPKAAYTAPDSIANRMRLVNLKASNWVDDTNQLSAQVYYRQSNARSQNSNAELDDGCFNDDGSLATSGAGFKCANQAPNGTAINSVTGPSALALGYGRWTGDINASLVSSNIRQDTVGASAQWASSAPVMDHKNAFVLGATFDQSNISYLQDTLLARMINYQTIVIPNQEYGFTANGLPPSASYPPAFTGSNILSSVALGARMKEADVFLTDTFDVTPNLSITASGSFEYTSIVQNGANSTFLNDDGGFSFTDDVTGVSYYNPAYSSAYKYSNSGAGAATTPNGAPAGAVAGPETNSLNGSHTYQRFNPRIGFNYNFDDGTGLFGGYSETMRAPTSIELSCANPNSPCALPTGFNGDPNLKAVTAQTYEFGARGLLFGKLAWNAAVYDSRLRNDIQFIATSATFGYFFNVGDTARRGVELGAQTQVDKLTLSASYGYVQAAYRSPFTTAAGEDVASGDRIPGIPASTFKLRAGYAVTDNFHLGGAVIAVSDQYAHGNENNADPTGKVPGYTVVDLDAQYQIGKSLTLALDVDNLFDQTYATYGLSGTASIYTLATEQFRTPAPPRGVWLKVTYAFGVGS